MRSSVNSSFIKAALLIVTPVTFLRFFWVKNISINKKEIGQKRTYNFSHLGRRVAERSKVGVGSLGGAGGGANFDDRALS